MFKPCVTHLRDSLGIALNRLSLSAEFLVYRASLRRISIVLYSQIHFGRYAKVEPRADGDELRI
jgi:hypothetical protein